MVDVKLTGIPETMLQTVFARAMETKKNRGLLSDEKSVSIINNLNYDFSNAEKDVPMQYGTIARTIVLDELVSKFIISNPKACVISIACGLDTRFLRLDNGNLKWYDLDLPETIEVRKKFFEESDRNKMIISSVLDFSWTEKVNTEKRPVLIIMEGLSMYLSEKNIKDILNCFTDKFHGATLYIETMPPIIVKHYKERSIDESHAKFTWGIKNGEKLAEYNSKVKFNGERSLVEGMKKMMPIYNVIGKIPFISNISNRIISLSI